MAWHRLAEVVGTPLPKGPHPGQHLVMKKVPMLPENFSNTKWRRELVRPWQWLYQRAQHLHYLCTRPDVHEWREHVAEEMTELKNPPNEVTGDWKTCQTDLLSMCSAVLDPSMQEELEKRMQWLKEQVTKHKK